ncbi:unnamed protein product [Cochlearia groenlandica]
MGRKKFSLFRFFKARRSSSSSSRRVEADSTWDCVVYTRKAWASDEDKCYCCVAEPGIDRKASAFIAKFHASRVSESERQTVPHCHTHHN